MIEFNGNFIQGTHESPTCGAPEGQTVRTKFAGVRGESEIRLEQGGRQITIRIWLHNRYASSAPLLAAIRQLDDMVLQHGDLRITNGPFGGVPAVYPNCTFEGFAKDPGTEAGPLPDNAGTLDGATPSWWCIGTLTWRQLSIEQG